MNLEEYLEEKGSVSVLKELNNLLKSKEQVSLNEYEELMEMDSSSRSTVAFFKDKKFSTELINHLTKRLSEFVKYNNDLVYHHLTNYVDWENVDILQDYCENRKSITRTDSWNITRDVKLDNLFKVSGFKNKSVFELFAKEFENLLVRVDEISSEPNESYGINISSNNFITYNIYKNNENIRMGNGMEKTEAYLRHLTGYNDTDYELLLDALSIIINGGTIQYALVFLGGKGIGKDMLIQSIQFMMNVDVSQFFTGLDGYFDNPYKSQTNMKRVVYFNEIAGDNLGVNIEKLKNDITSTERVGREIYGKEKTVPNITTLIIASNNINLIDYIPSDNRRMCIFDLHVKKIGKLSTMVKEKYNMEIKPFRNEVANELGDFREYLRKRKVDINEFVKAMDIKCSNQKEDRVSKLIKAISESNQEDFLELMTNYNVQISNEDIDKIMDCDKLSKKALFDLIKMFKKGFKTNEFNNYDTDKLLKIGRNTTADVLVYDTKHKYFTINEKHNFSGYFFTKLHSEKLPTKKSSKYKNDETEVEDIIDKGLYNEAKSNATNFLEDL